MKLASASQDKLTTQQTTFQKMRGKEYNGKESQYGEIYISPDIYIKNVQCVFKSCSTPSANGPGGLCLLLDSSYLAPDSPALSFSSSSCILEIQKGTICCFPRIPYFHIFAYILCGWSSLFHVSLLKSLLAFNNHSNNISYKTLPLNPTSESNSSAKPLFVFYLYIQCFLFHILPAFKLLIQVSHLPCKMTSNSWRWLSDASFDLPRCLNITGAKLSPP